MDRIIVETDRGVFAEFECVGHVPAGPTGAPRCIIADSDHRCFAAEIAPSGWRLLKAPIPLHT